MTQIQDIIGSIIIGGIILLMLMTFNGNVMESAGLQTFKTTLQGNLTTFSDIVEHDFRKMGYRVAYPQDSAIVYADTTSITFKGDFNDDGTLDSIRYWFDPTPVPGISNPHIGVLLRQFGNGQPQRFYLGMTRFTMRYYDYRDTLLADNPVANPSDIKSIRLFVSIESSERYYDGAGMQVAANTNTDTSYAGIYWERKISPMNIR